MPHSQIQPQQQHTHLSTILKLFPEKEHNCVGYFPSKERRCHTPTSAASRRSVCSLLDKGTTELHAGKSIDSILSELAPFALCKRFHQGQAGDMVTKWKGMIAEFQAAQAAQAANRARKMMQRAARGQLSKDDRIELLKALLGEAVKEHEEDRRRRSRNSSSAEENAPASTNVRSSRCSSSRRPPPVATRKPVGEDCDICMLQLRDPDSTRPTEEEQGDEGIVWCKARCGTNFHKTCMDEWIASCKSNIRRTTCPYCRVIWQD